MATHGIHIRTPFVRILLLLPALAALVRLPLAAQENCAQVTRESHETLSTLPGQVFTTSVRVHNPSPFRTKYSATLVLPAGWRVLTGDAPFDLEAGGSDIRLISFSVPPSAEPGSHELHYSVSNDAVPPCWTTFNLEISVEPLRNLQLQVLETPRYAVAGRHVRTLVAVRNLGNESCSARLTVRSGEGWTATPDSSVVSLGPRETKSIGIDIMTDPSLSRNLKYVLEVKGVLEQDSTVVATTSFPVELVPNLSAGKDLYHQIPLMLKMRFAGEDQTAGAQIEVQSAGTITDKGTERYDLFIRTPDIQSRSVLGYRDEYRLGYYTDKYAAQLGDKSYELSPLTELARNAFGLEARARVGDFTAGGFVNKTRFFSPPQKEQAGFLSYGFDSLNAASLNFLHKDDLLKSNVYTLRGQVRPVRQNDVDVEFGLSTLNGTADEAIAARVQGTEQWTSYDVRFVRAGTNYGGYYRDVEFRSASFNLQPWSRVHIEFYGRDERRNLTLDTLLFVAPRDQYYLVGAGYGDLLSVYYRVNDQADRLPAAKYAARENAVQVRSGYTFPLCSVVASLEFGSTDDRILHESNPFQRYQASANIRPDAHQNYGVGLEYSNERFFNAGEATGRWSGSVSAGYYFSGSTEILASLQGSRTAAPFVQTYSLADLSVQQVLPFGHIVTLRGRQSIFTPSTNGKEIAYLLEYTVPLSIPLTPISTSGQLRGKVVDTLGAGLAGIILNAEGATAVTDESGEFLFPALRPGEYQLQVDLGTAGFDRVTALPSPTEVTVRGGEKTELEIRVISGASIKGSVMLYAFREPQPAESAKTEYAEVRGVPNVLVELTKEGETQRRITDNRGNFQFLNIRPGEWNIRVVDGDLPPYTYFERDSLKVTLQSGEKQSHQFRVLPRRRKIQILQERSIEPENEAPKPVVPPPHKPR